MYKSTTFMENSHIEWTDHTFNPWWGCMKVSDGCKNCYAETLDNRYHNENPHWGPGSSRKPQSDAYWKQPLKWNEAAKKAGIQAKVFCASMADVFEDHPDVIEHRKRLFLIIRQTPHLIWQLLTKRPENVMKVIPDGTWGLMDWTNGLPDNVWIGTSIENNKVYDRVEHLVQIPAVVKFLSCEPLLGPIELPIDCNDGSSFVDWVICGGESGPKARPMHPDWARSLRDQCRASGAAFFFKQWGEWMPGEGAGLWTPNNHPTKPPQYHYGIPFWKMGKYATGALLDGVEYKMFPKTEPVLV